MTHRWPHRLDVGGIKLHPNLAVENFESWAVPVLDDVMMCGKTFIYKGAQIFPDHLASMPISDAQVAHRILGKAVKALAESFVINFFPHGQKPIRSRGFREGYRVHIILRIFIVYIDYIFIVFFHTIMVGSC